MTRRAIASSAEPARRWHRAERRALLPDGVARGPHPGRVRQGRARVGRAGDEVRAEAGRAGRVRPLDQGRRPPPDQRRGGRLPAAAARPAPDADDRREHPDDRRAGAGPHVPGVPRRPGRGRRDGPAVRGGAGAGELPDVQPPGARRPAGLAAEQLPGRAVRAGLDDQAVRRRAGLEVAGHAGERDLADPGPEVQDAVRPHDHGRPRLPAAGDVGRAGEVEQHRDGDARRADGQPEAVRGPLRLGLRPADRHRAARRERRPPQPAAGVDQVQHRVRRRRATR